VIGSFEPVGIRSKLLLAHRAGATINYRICRSADGNMRLEWKGGLPSKEASDGRGDVAAIGGVSPDRD
jgi:hypothetical protein